MAVTADKEIRRMMCSQPVNQPLASNTRRTAFCSVHLSTNDEDDDDTPRARQADRVCAEVDSYLSMDYRLILGGDFNLFHPPSAESAAEQTREHMAR